MSWWWCWRARGGSWRQKDWAERRQYMRAPCHRLTCTARADGTDTHNTGLPTHCRAMNNSWRVSAPTPNQCEQGAGRRCSPLRRGAAGWACLLTGGGGRSRSWAARACRLCPDGGTAWALRVDLKPISVSVLATPAHPARKTILRLTAAGAASTMETSCNGRGEIARARDRGRRPAPRSRPAAICLIVPDSGTSTLHTRTDNASSPVATDCW